MKDNDKAIVTILLIVFAIVVLVTVFTYKMFNSEYWLLWFIPVLAILGLLAIAAYKFCKKVLNPIKKLS